MEFSLEKPKYDLTKYSGRFSYFLELTDPRFLFYTPQQVHEAKSVLDAYKQTGKIVRSHEYMWLQRRIYESAIHSYTGEIINPLFRVAAIAPVNIPIVFTMITIPASNVPATLFMHWFNQSYNFACNYANRPGESISTNSLIASYSLAITSACGAAYGLGKIPALRRFGGLIPFLSCGIANVSNIAFTRISELKEGTNIYDKDGNSIGKSVIAGQIGIAQTSLTRGILVPAACILVPPVIIHGLKVIKLFPQKSKSLAMVIELFIIYASLQMALPAALALYPQKFELSVEKLEPGLRTKLQQYKIVYANKGL